ncbi:interleukin-36 alpha-like [Gracilinanus agilis]|uniref:interleukin-36 alpha-like n=1 Tax=Gracilinanus agilis TaxID=191870 RepID=UPI001CFCD5EA|nr:interleukin-36 alpha-like [Gracilinanus agilis]
MSRLYHPHPQNSGSSSEPPDAHARESLIYPVYRKIRDIHQHVFVLQERTLIAVPEDGNVTPIILETVTVTDDSLENSKGDALYLGITEQKQHLCLCCVANEGPPTLKLEEKYVMDLPRTDKAVKSFVFYRNEAGNISTFESAAFPGWFISSEEQGKPMKITNDVGKNNISFSIYF